MMLPEAKLYIDGVIRSAAGGRTYDKIGPWTGAVVGKAADASGKMWRRPSSLPGAPSTGPTGRRITRIGTIY